MNSLKKEYHGLLNQGATCYLNSVLQVLFMTEDFREAVGRQSCENPECIDPHLYTLFDDLKQGTAYTYKITKKLGINKVNVQRDAAEYYEKILRLTSPDASQIFHGLSTHKTTCSSCNTETGTDEAFWHLPLALVDSYSEHYSVLDGIEEYFKTSEFKEENQMYCEQCDAKSDATSKYVMKHHPEVLMLLLKRFEFDYCYMTHVKINQSVDVPRILQIPENQTYELYAVVDHFGGLRSGHYTATIKANERWYNFDDARVTVLNYQQFEMNNLKQSSTAYLLFYKKIKAHAADTCTQESTEESRPEGFTPVTIDISDQHEDDVKMKKREKGEREAEAGDDIAVAVSTVSDKHVHPNKEGEMSVTRKRKMKGDEQSEKKMKSSKKYSEREPEHQDSEGFGDVRENLNKGLGGTQQPLSVDEKDEKDGKKIEIDVEVDKEGNTGSKTGQLLPNHDPCSQEMSELVSGGVGDSQQDIPRYDQRCRQESSSRCERPEQQREERGDDKHTQRRETSLRQQHFGRHAEHQDSEGLDDVGQNLNKDLGGPQQGGQDYDFKPLSVGEEGDGKKIEINVEVHKEGNTGSETGQLLPNLDLCSQKRSDSGGVGDSQQDIPRNDQRCRQESSSTCKRPEQQREERDDKHAQRRGTSLRQQHFGRHAEYQGSERFGDVRQNLKKDVGGAQQVGHEFDLKPGKMEVNVYIDEEIKSGSDDDVSGGVGDSQQDVLRNNQGCRQESRSRCKRPEQQREERGDYKDAQRRESSQRHEHHGQSVEDQNKASEQRDSVRHTGYKHVGMERQAKEQEKKRDEHIQNREKSSLRRAGSEGCRRVTENQEICRVEKMRQSHPQPKARNEFTGGSVEGRPGSKTSRPCIVSTDDKIEDCVKSSNEKSYILHKESHKLSQVEHNEGNVQRKSGPKTDENVILSKSVHSLQRSESGLQEPQEHRSKRATRNAQVEAAEMNCALEKIGEIKTRKWWHCFSPLTLQHKQKNKQKTKEKKERKKIQEKQKTQGCFPFPSKRWKNAVQTSESED